MEYEGKSKIFNYWFIFNNYSFLLLYFSFSGNNKVLGIDLNSTKSVENTIDYELILGGWMDGLTMSFGNLAHSRNINEVFQINNLGLIYASITLILLSFVI